MAEIVLELEVVDDYKKNIFQIQQESYTNSQKLWQQAQVLHNFQLDKTHHGRGNKPKVSLIAEELLAIYGW